MDCQRNNRKRIKIDSLADMEVGSGVTQKIKPERVPNHIFIIKETMIDTNLTLDTNLTEEQIEKIIMCINFFIENCKFENEEENEILLDVLRIQTVLNATIAMNTLSANPKYIN